jgi:hypothetical protein
MCVPMCYYRRVFGVGLGLTLSFGAVAVQNISSSKRVENWLHNSLLVSTAPGFYEIFWRSRQFGNFKVGAATPMIF